MMDSALFASSEDCDGAASTARVTAASTVTELDALATCMAMGRFTVTPEPSFNVRLSAENPGTATSTEYVPPGRPEIENLPSSPVAAVFTAPRDRA